MSRYSLPTQQRFDAQERHVGGRRGGPCKSVMPKVVLALVTHERDKRATETGLRGWPS